MNRHSSVSIAAIVQTNKIVLCRCGGHAEGGDQSLECFEVKVSVMLTYSQEFGPECCNYIPVSYCQRFDKAVIPVIVNCEH